MTAEEFMQLSAEEQDKMLDRDMERSNKANREAWDALPKSEKERIRKAADRSRCWEDLSDE